MANDRQYPSSAGNIRRPQGIGLKAQEKNGSGRGANARRSRQ
jgi:hypothetical protein